MGRWTDEYATLLGNADYVQAMLAKGLLKEAGIPCLLYGPDRGHAELGASERAGFEPASVLVPWESLDRAREVLAAAWGEDAPDAGPGARRG